jgi:hypothetical protein
MSEELIGEYVPAKLDQDWDAAPLPAEQAAPELPPSSQSPTIVDADGLPRVVADVMRNPNCVLALSALYSFIDTWGEKQRRIAVRAAARQAPTATPKEPLTFGMNGPKMTFTVGVQTFALDYEPVEPGEFEYMAGMLAKAVSAARQAPTDLPYRVYEFWSSSRPGVKVLMLAEGRYIEEWTKRDDFIRDVTGLAARLPPQEPVGAPVARDAALEEAATECERMMMWPNARQESQVHGNVWEAARAIRALKSGAQEKANG